MSPCSHIVTWLTVEAGQFLSGLNAHGDADFLSPEERQKLSTLRFSNRSSSWLLGRRAAKTLLRRACPDLTYLPETAITIANEPSGAPVIQVDGRQSYPGCLSITHRLNLALAAYCPTPGWRVGIDLEQVEARHESFLHDFFTPGEVETARACRGELHALWITLAWSVKESVLKALGAGLRLDTRSVEVGLADGLENSVQRPAQWQDVTVRSPLFQDGCCRVWWQPRDGFILTLAVLAPDARPLPPDDVCLIELPR